MGKNLSYFASQGTTSNTFLKVLSIIVSSAFQSAAGQTQGLPNMNVQLAPEISAYEIFEGVPGKLNPGKGFVQYELVMGSFTDFAEKKRFVKIPEGQSIAVAEDGLPIFPDGSMLVKTFYYFNDKRNPTLGIHLMETRVMLKLSGRWIAGTYRWNNTGTEAKLSDNFDSKVSWIDANGKQIIIQYHIPSAKQCIQCHQLDNKFLPIGPKIRNLNTRVNRNGTDINQLEHLRTAGIIDIDRNVLASIVSRDNEHSTGHRAKAYLDINCGHCHQKAGYCSRSELKLSSASMENSMLAKKSRQIDKMISTGRMPMIGATRDTAGIALIKQYLDTLK